MDVPAAAGGTGKGATHASHGLTREGAMRASHGQGREAAPWTDGECAKRAQTDEPRVVSGRMHAHRPDPAFQMSGIRSIFAAQMKSFSDSPLMAWVVNCTRQ